MTTDTEVLTEMELKELSEYRARLRKMPSEDVTAEWLYRDDALQSLGRDSLDATDEETTEFLAFLVIDHRRKRDECSTEIHRRQKANLLPGGHAVTAITPALIQEIKDRVDIREIVESAGVSLKQHGREWVGKCLFHEEDTPSFRVNTIKGVFHCFGCNASGDVIAFLMRANQCDFITALRDLAGLAGIEIPKRNGNGNGNGHGPNGLPSEKHGIADFANTDAGNGEVFTFLFGDRIRFDHRRQRWLIWTGSRWKPDMDGEVERLAIQVARKRLAAAADITDKDECKKAASWALQSEARYRRRTMLESAAILKPIADPGDHWDEDDWLLGCENGVVDLRTGTLRPAKPEDRITMSTGVAFDPNARAERWEQFLREIFEHKEVIDYFQRVAGYSLSGTTNEQILVICYGSGSNGKSVLLTALRAATGDYAANTAFSTLEQADRNNGSNDVAALVGRRLVTASEVRESARLNEARVKALTGGDPITARFLYGEYFTFQPKAKLWLAVNHKPRVSDDSYGFWRRIRLIPFTRVFKADQADRTLGQALQNEAAGILAWMVRGCTAWQDRGLEAPQLVTKATEEYREESDPLANFFAEQCVIEPTAECTSTDLYKAYCVFSEACGEQPMKRTAFGRRLADRGFDKYRPRGREKTCYIGIGLRQAEETSG